MLRVVAGLCLPFVMLAGIASLGQAQERQGGRRSQAPPGREAPHPPAVGEAAPGLELKNLQDELVTLKSLTEKGPVVLLVLRGWPGYQCPICNRQVGEFLGKRADFERAGASVVMVYPGPADHLADHAQEFRGDKVFPATFQFVTDPDYAFTTAWGLRWEALRETAYPSTFVIGRDGKVKFGQTSTSHGGRVSATQVLEELAKLP